jgi:hypothetical protein
MANGLCVDLWRRRGIEQAWHEALATRPESEVPSVEDQSIMLQALHEVDAMLRTLSTKAPRSGLGTSCRMVRPAAIRRSHRR